VIVIAASSRMAETVEMLEVLVKMTQCFRVLVPAFSASGEAARGVADLVFEFLSLETHLEWR